MPLELEDEIRAWIVEWNGKRDSELESFLLPKTSEPQSMRQPPAETGGDGMHSDSFMAEESSKRKTKRNEGTLSIT